MIDSKQGPARVHPAWRGRGTPPGSALGSSQPRSPAARVGRHPALAILCLAAFTTLGFVGCARDEVRSDEEVCTRLSWFADGHCPAAALYAEEFLSPPTCTQGAGDCRAENVRGPTLKDGTNGVANCCYVYTRVQKPDPIF